MVDEASFSFFSYSVDDRPDRGNYQISEIFSNLRSIVEYQIFDPFSDCTSIRNYYRYNYYYDIFILDVNSNGGNK